MLCGSDHIRASVHDWGNDVGLSGGEGLQATWDSCAIHSSIVARLEQSGTRSSTSWKARLQRIDHSMIFLVVAGTFTPIAIAALDGASLVVGLSIVWAVAVTGILLKAFLPHVRTGLSLTLQLAMGWSALVWVPTINTELGTAAVALIGIGGLCYTVGVVIFTTKRPRLFPRSFSYHELFHVLVIAGSVIHFLVVFRFAIPAMG